MLNEQPLPSSRHVIPLFIMHLHEKNLQVSSIRNYLSAIAFTHKIHDYGDPTKSFKITKLLDGLKKMSISCRKRLPITLPVLKRIVENCQHIAADKYENRLYKCIFLLMYHACLRVGEVTASQHCLMASQIKIKDENLCITFHSFKHSKNRSVKIKIPRTHDKFCPVNAYQSYARIRGSTPGPAFLTKDHKAMRRNKIASVLHDCLSISSRHPEHYNTHSFRVGKISDLATSGHSVLQIKELGRFHSFAFLSYIKPISITHAKP